MMHRLFPTELKLNNTNAPDTEAAFSDLNLFINNVAVPTKVYDKRDDFDIVNFPCLDCVVPLMWLIYLNIFTLPEYLCMLVACKSFGIISSAKLCFQILP